MSERALIDRRIIRSAGFQFQRWLFISLGILAVVSRLDGQIPGITSKPAPAAEAAADRQAALGKEIAATRTRMQTMIEKRFGEAGIAFPFPQRDMHLRTGAPLQIEWTPPAAPAHE